MRTPPPPTAPLAIHLAPNASTLLCMPAGSTLRLASGSLAIHAGPLILGQVIAAQQPTGVLHAQGEWTASAHPSATWLRVSNCAPAPAAAWLLEAPATAGISRTAWNALRGWWTQWHHTGSHAGHAKRWWPFNAAGSR